MPVTMLPHTPHAILRADQVRALAYGDVAGCIASLRRECQIRQPLLVESSGPVWCAGERIPHYAVIGNLAARCADFLATGLLDQSSYIRCLEALHSEVWRAMNRAACWTEIDNRSYREWERMLFARWTSLLWAE